MVVYANTSAQVKARADWLVTSSCALEIVRTLKDAGHKILWAPDRHLGRYIERETGADMLFWNGACIVRKRIQGVGAAIAQASAPECQNSRPSRKPGRGSGTG